MALDNVLYRAVIVPIQKSSDGETPTSINVTHEVNGYAVIEESAEGTRCLRWSHWDRDGIVEWAVDYARKVLT